MGRGRLRLVALVGLALTLGACSETSGSTTTTGAATTAPPPPSTRWLDDRVRSSLPTAASPSPVVADPTEWGGPKSEALGQVEGIRLLVPPGQGDITVCGVRFQCLMMRRPSGVCTNHRTVNAVIR
jgi:hypothetical protein